MVQDEAHERDHIREDVEIDLEVRIVNVEQVVDSLPHRFDGAQDEGTEGDSVEVYVLLPSFDVVQQDASLVDVVDALFLGDVG